MSIKLKIEATLDDEWIGNVLVTAFDGQYGSCWYWAIPATGSWLAVKHASTCAIIATEWSTVPPMCTCSVSWKSVVIRDKEDPSLSWVVTENTIKAGLERILSNAIPIRSDLRDQIFQGVVTNDADIDADAADCIIQAGIFNEIVYG